MLGKGGVGLDVGMTAPRPRVVMKFGAKTGAEVRAKSTRAQSE